MQQPFSWTLRALALSAVVLTSGCAYVKSFYGDPAPKSLAAATPKVEPLYTPQQHFKSDISAAKVYVGTQLPVNQRITLIDVRDATEYRMGHPEGARHLPYPRVFQSCEPHPSGAPEAQIRSDDGSECRYGTKKGSQVMVSPAAFWKAAQVVLPYQDAPIAVLCRTRGCAVDAANILARPDLFVDKTLAGQGYTEVMVVREGFVGEVMPAQQPDGQWMSTQSKLEKLQVDGKTTVAVYGAPAVALDADGDGHLTSADYGGWRNFLGLPYVVSMHPNLLSEEAQPYYEQP